MERVNFVEDSLEYYIKQLHKLNEKKASFEFIDDLLSSGIDINHLSKSSENVLFQVLDFNFLKIYFAC